MFLFIYVCDLLEKLWGLHNNRRLLHKDVIAKSNEVIIDWLRHHNAKLSHFETDIDAVVRSLRPEKSNGWYYGLDAQRLEQIIARALALSRARYAELRKWQDDHLAGDLCVCVERVMQNGPATSRLRTDSVSCEEINQALLVIAANQPSSSSEVRDLALPDDTNALDLLGSIYKKLQPREAKWLTRLILKDYGSINIPDELPDSSNYNKMSLIETTIQFPVASPVPTRRKGTSLMKGYKRTRAIQSLASKAPASSVRSPDSREYSTSLPSNEAIQPLQQPKQVQSTQISTSPATDSRAPLSSISANVATATAESYPHPTPSPTLAPTPRFPSLQNMLFHLPRTVNAPNFLTQNLITKHNAKLSPSLTHFLTITALPKSRPHSHPLRKILLLDSHHTAGSIKFLRKIIRHRSKYNKKITVKDIDVFDWRITECVAKQDRGRVFRWNIWERCFLGRV